MNILTRFLDWLENLFPSESITTYSTGRALGAEPVFEVKDRWPPGMQYGGKPRITLPSDYPLLPTGAGYTSSPGRVFRDSRGRFIRDGNAPRDARGRFVKPGVTRIHVVDPDA